MHNIVYADNISYLSSLPDGYVDLIYVDVPFNTGKTQKRIITKTEKATNDGPQRFCGETYDITKSLGSSYNDKFDDYIGFLEERIIQAYRILKPNGSFYLHLDYRELAYVTIMLDKIFGRKNHLNNIEWEYDWGAKSKSKWSTKHDTILFYVKDVKNYTFNFDKIPRIPYLCPELVTPEKAAKGKIVTDVWFHTIVPTNAKYKTSYPTEKPPKLLKRIVEVSSNEGDVVLDFFAGSGAIAYNDLNRNYILVDNNIQAIDTMRKRFAEHNYIEE